VYYTDDELPALLMRRYATNRTVAAVSDADAAMGAVVIVIVITVHG